MSNQYEEKRLRDADTLSPHTSPKKQKVSEQQDSNNRMDSKELASAFALASLASFSPGMNQSRVRKINNDHKETTEEFAAATALWETRSPKSEPMIISPEIRSPVRSIKRVHFHPTVKTQHSPTAASHQPRQYPFHSPVSSQHSQQPFPIRMNSPSGYGVFQVRQQHPPWMQARMGLAPPPPHQRMMRPPPAVNASDQHWICDFCNAAAFNTYEEACVHEEACRLQCAPTSHHHPENERKSPMVFHGFGSGSHEMAAEDDSIHGQDRGLNNSAGVVAASRWFSGSVSLSIPDSDSEWLSEVNCFIRKYCIEAFSATEEDVASTSKRGRISLHQVGIRCRYCKHRPLKERAVAAVSYPTSVAGIYESVKRWQRVHVEHCEDVPTDVSSKMTELQNTNVWIPTTRQYWTDSARVLGMVDTEGGIRFSCDPKYLTDSNKNDTGEAMMLAPPVDDKQPRKLLADGDYIVFPEDMHIVPPYVYFLMRQVESCHFSEVDRFVARSKGPVGYPGFQCRHCSGHAGLGKYFPVSSKTLSTNSTSQNIHAHLLKCRKCPENIKEKLIALKLEKSRSPRLEPGWRKIFFDKVWARLHG